MDFARSSTAWLRSLTASGLTPPASDWRWMDWRSASIGSVAGGGGGDGAADVEGGVGAGTVGLAAAPPLMAAPVVAGAAVVEGATFDEGPPATGSLVADRRPAADLFPVWVAAMSVATTMVSRTATIAPTIHRRCLGS